MLVRAFSSENDEEEKPLGRGGLNGANVGIRAHVINRPLEAVRPGHSRSQRWACSSAVKNHSEVE